MTLPRSVGQCQLDTLTSVAAIGDGLGTEHRCVVADPAIREHDHWTFHFR
jgi:hypothetical protein